MATMRRAILPQARRSYSSLRINPDRLMETLHHTCQWGEGHRYASEATQTGMSRLSLSDADGQARRWFADETSKAGCALTVDSIGNMFAKRPGGGGTHKPMIAMGSHLDTQPRGGRYDGILGVVAAVEVLRTLHENGRETHHDVGAVNWTNEEGARFPKSMMGSGVWAGKIPLDKAYALQDIFDPSVTVESELRRLGYLGEASRVPLGAHFELHIEQGPILQETGKRIGVVRGSQAYRWITVTVTGRDAHTGTTPLSSRSDPLLAASKMIVASNAAARRLGALASTGVIKIPAQSSTNTILSEVVFTLDIRHPQDSVLQELQRRLAGSFRDIAKADGRGVRWEWETGTQSAAATFDEDCVRAVEQAATGLVGDGWMGMISGAGHDSVYASSRCPTAMIFVPCKDGVSHHPEEYCSPEDCALGAQALLDAVLGYDELKAETPSS